jgi:hypothetical protein
MLRFLIIFFGVSCLIISWHFLAPNVAPAFNFYWVPLLFLPLLTASSHANFLPFLQWLGVRKSTPHVSIPATESEFGLLVLATGIDPAVELVPHFRSDRNE